MQNWINNKLIAMQIWAADKAEAREEGQGTVEYAVVLGVLVVAIVAAFTVADVQGAVKDALKGITDLLAPAAPAA